MVISERTDVNKSNKSKEYITCDDWYFLDKCFAVNLCVCYGCHGVLMMSFGLENITILNVQGAHYRCNIWNMNRSDAIIKLNCPVLDNKRSL